MAPRPYAKLSDEKNDEGYFVVVSRSIADDDVAAERGLIEMPRGGPGWWYDDSDGSFRPPVPPVSERKAELRTAVDRQYQRTLQRGVAYDNTRWTATDKSRDTLKELLEIAQDFDQSVTILDANGTVFTYSASKLDALRLEGAKYRQSARENRLIMYGQIDAATTHDELDAIDPASGWPS